ncbi:MAG: hypoxanthine phosphoribosyltransferase [Parcubacteria group bacterium]|nr:hypoxanthine phosphoribosyltransferase [Parcubacteria group bacterium]
MGDAIRVLKNASEIKKRVKELGAEISRDYEGKDVVLIGILKGAVFFLTDLAREIQGVPLTIEFMRLSSYNGETTSSGVAQILSDVTQPIEGKHVLIVEDIIDTGRTMHFLVEYLKTKKPASIKISSLLYKPVRNVVPVEIHYLGFEIPDVFVVGYGMDYKGEYRNLPFVGVLPEMESPHA